MRTLKLASIIFFQLIPHLSVYEKEIMFVYARTFVLIRIMRTFSVLMCKSINKRPGLEIYFFK